MGKAELHPFFQPLQEENFYRCLTGRGQLMEREILNRPQAKSPLEKDASKVRSRKHSWWRLTFFCCRDIPSCSDKSRGLGRCHCTGWKHWDVWVGDKLSSNADRPAEGGSSTGRAGCSLEQWRLRPLMENVSLLNPCKKS